MFKWSFKGTLYLFLQGIEPRTVQRETRISMKTYTQGLV